MKRVAVILFIFLYVILFATPLIYSQENFINSVNENVEKMEETKEKIDDFTDNDKWEYLGKEWEKILLENPIISSIDSFFQKISFLFEIIVGMHYSLSLWFFFVILIWFYLLFNLKYLLKAFFPSGISLALSFIILLLFARLNFFDKVISVSKNIFTLLGGFIKILPLLILAFILIFLFLSYFFESAVKSFVAYYLGRIKGFSEEQYKQDNALFHSFIEGISKSFKK
jgi:hypothetical protein